MISVVLGGSSIILGLYILINHLVINEPPIPSFDISYHLGCYDAGSQLNHSSQLSQKILGLTENYESSIKLNMFNSKALAPEFSKSVVKMAGSFENFLNEHYKMKQTNDRNIDYYNALQLARLDADRCQDKIAEEIQLTGKQCTDLWEQYQKSREQFENIKENLGNAIDHKEKLEYQLAAMVLSQNYGNSDEIYDSYNSKITQLEKKLAEFEIDLAELKGERKVTFDNIRYITEQLTSFNNFLNECKQNKKQISYCKKISEQILKIGDNAPKRSKNKLSSRKAEKKKLINSLETNLKRLNKFGSFDEIREAEQMLKHQRIQLQLLEAQIVNFSTMEQSKCQMCSESRMIELRKNITDLEIKKEEFEQSLQKYTESETTLNHKIKQLQKQIFDLQQQRQQDLNARFCMDEQCKQEQKQKISTLSSSLNEIKKEIIDKQIQINFLKSSIVKQTSKINAMIPKIDKVNDCMRKKQYYEELRKMEPTNRIGMGTQTVDAKNYLVAQLNKL